MVLANEYGVSLATSLATSLAGEFDPAPWEHNLCVRYQLKGSTTHLAFSRYELGDLWNGGTRMYCWRCVDTIAIDRLFTFKVGTLTTSDLLYRHEDNSYVISDGTIEEISGSIWTDKFSVVVFNLVDNNNYNIQVTCEGENYSNMIPSFCALSASLGSPVVIEWTGASGTKWSDGVTANPRTDYVSAENRGLIVERITEE